MSAAESGERLPSGRGLLQTLRTRTILWIVWCCLLLLMGAAMASFQRFASSADGISYLDLARRLRSGDLTPLVHSYWSPGYSALLAVFVGSGASEPVTDVVRLHVLSLVLYVCSMAAFVFFIRTFAGGRLALAGTREFIATLLMLGAVFWMTAEQLSTTASLGGPDALVNISVLLAASFGYRLVTQPEKALRSGFWLGVVLGLGYVGKAAVLPIGIILLACLVVPARRSRRLLCSVGLAALVMAALSAPLIIGMSLHRGRLTIGDAGRLNYVWMINKVDEFVGWTGSPGQGVPEHGPRVLHRNPKVLEFAQPVTGTYPLWIDPVWWHEGVRPRIQPVRNIAIAFSTGASILLDLVTTLMPFIAAAAAFAAFGLRALRSDHATVRLLLALAWPLLVYAMYCAVGQLQTRYIAAFVAIAVVEVLFALSAALPEAVRSAVLITLGVVVLGQPLKSSIRQARAGMNPESLPFSRLHAASHILHREGLPSGSQVAILAPGIDFDAQIIARSAGFRVTTQVFDPARYWQEDESARADVLSRLQGAGVRALLTTAPLSPYPAGEGWKHIPGSATFYLLLSPGKPYPQNGPHAHL